MYLSAQNFVREDDAVAVSFATGIIYFYRRMMIAVRINETVYRLDVPAAHHARRVIKLIGRGVVKVATTKELKEKAEAIIILAASSAIDKKITEE